MVRSLLCVAVVLTASVVQATNGADSVRVSCQALNGPLYLLTSSYQHDANQVLSVGADGKLLVDVGWTETASKLRETIDSFPGGPARLVINTHSHDDHASGNRLFRHESNIVAQRNVPSHMGNSYFSLPPMESPDSPTILVDDSLTIQFNGEKVRLLHWPNGHSDADLVVYFTGSQVVCVGDLAFPDHFPYIDLSAGGNPKNYLDYVKRLVDSFPAETRYVAGHGRIYNRQDMLAYYDELTKQEAAVRASLTSERTVADVQKDSVLAKWNSWSGPWATTDANYWIATLARMIRPSAAPAVSICSPLTETIVRSGVEAAVAQYRQLRSAEPQQYNFAETELNILGYNLLYRRQVNDAVAILKLNTEAYPNSFNVYDSYGEALLVKGDTANAVVNYRKSLALNANNTNAADVLKKLGK